MDMYRILCDLILIMLLRTSNISAETTGVLFLIASQDDPYHRPLATRLCDDIIYQAESELSKSNYIITVHILHKIFNFSSYWAIKNVLPVVRSKLLGEHTKWVVWLEESTHVALLELLQHLEQEDATQLLYLGHTLYDNQANIRHHFAFHKDPSWFPFPFQRAGIVFSRALIIKTADALDKQSTSARDFPFTIDMEYELALFIYNEVKADYGESNHAAEGHTDANNSRKVLMRKAHYICPRSSEEIPISSNKKCAMYAKPLDKSNCITAHPESIFFAVKTCKRFHNDRLPIIKATWGRIATHIRYYSDVADSEIPTISTGVPNTEIGHCEKTCKIFKLALHDIDEFNMQFENLVQDNQIQWLVLADDDTLLSIPRICELLGCFDSTTDLYLGERFGFHYETNGFNYITSGGSVVMSLSAVRKLITNCHCPQPQHADDMLIGNCFDTLGIPTTHSSQFHQYQHLSYPEEVLALDPPISFHKFYNTDPYAVYNLYFSSADQKMGEKIFK
ncbi:beta-1,3-glucosyltransferase isoform X2 [Eurosta solidaginis]|uniref:beta-1,3-glucosyltransferase isoform X2 n=1 Tax=Eurosta solidaginis TaxID=178769 RepID=UPI003530CC98